ncbi:unnamed protein product [Larinioides sclopetarius]
MKTITFQIIYILLLGCSSAISDLHPACIDFSSTNNIYPQSTPYGNLSAGTYKKISDAVTFPDCVQACCEDNKCNIAFLHNTICFTLHCHSYKLCKPLKRKGKKYQNSLVVIVRMPGEKFLFGNEFADDDNEK